jgi:hypothetical protein
MQSLGIHGTIPLKARLWKDSPREVDKRSLTERDIGTTAPAGAFRSKPTSASTLSRRALAR